MARVALPFGIGTPEQKRVHYRAALRLAGIEPVEGVASLGGLDGLLLAGGTDVDPQFYGAVRAAETDEPDGDRDFLERALLGEALARDLPVLGICRGMQFLNVHFGGALKQHIVDHRKPKQRDVHEIEIAPGSRLERILGTRRYSVNSRHHQGVERAAVGLTAAAKAAGDGIVEALELPGPRFALAVQWHPEARTDGPDLRLFEAFREAMRAS
jgi:gamma-glutamyl-gamma-aminobutyrate hydrolase PuuD